MAEAKLPEGADVDRLLDLANLALDGDERAAIARDLARIVGHVAMLGELALDDVPPTRALGFDAVVPGADEIAVARARLALGSDAPHTELDRDVALRESPRPDDEGFAVPGYVDEG